MPAHQSPLFLDRRIFGGRLTVLAAIFVVGLLLTVGALVTFWWSGDGKFVTTAFFLAFGAMIVPVGVKVGHLMLEGMGGQLDVFLKATHETPGIWFSRAMEKRLREMAVVYGAAAGFAVLSLIAFAQGGAFKFPGVTDDTAVWLRFQMILTVGVAGFMSGLGLALMVLMASLIWDFDRFEVKLAPHMFGICVVGDTLLKIYGMIALIWLVFSSSAVVGLEQSAVPLSALAGLSMVMFLVSFPLCLLPLHNRMVKEKHRLVVSRYQRLERLSEDALEVRDDAHTRRYAEAKREYQEALDLPEWPFGWKAMAALTTSGVVSNLPAIIAFATKNLFV